MAFSGFAPLFLEQTNHAITLKLAVRTTDSKIVMIRPSTTCDTCPELDYLLVGGPDPFTFKLSDRFTSFLQAHVAANKILFTTCTGAFAVASSGILDGKNATVNHGVIDLAKQKFPNVKWDKDLQWVVDGNIWTSGGAYAGADMMARWVVENYGQEIANVGFEALDFQPRDVLRKQIVL